MNAQATVEDLQKAFYKAKPKFYPSRQRFTLPTKPGEKKATAVAPGKKLSDYDIKDGSVLVFKDLGPQVNPNLVTDVLNGGLWPLMCCISSMPTITGNICCLALDA